MADDYLQHYGIKGMHWGHRKNRTRAQPNQPKNVFKLKNQRKSNQLSEEEAFERMICIVGMKYPQYSLEQLRDEIPFRQLKRMFKEINRRRAETLLLLNGIINGPNAKSKSKSEYKNIIKELTDELDGK